MIYLLSEYLFAFMFLRIYFLIICYFNYSIYNDAYSMKLCRFYGFQANSQFTFKSIILTNPEMTTIALFAFSISILAYLLRIFEMGYYRLSDDEWR